MRELFAGIPAQLVEVLIYSAIALVFVTGLVKSVLPMRRLARLFRRAIRQLELMVNKEGTRPVWQEPLFLGKPMQEQWGRFLQNAQQLDARGLSCATEDYINDEDIFPAYAHLQLAEVIPGLLTSLGILGTFIGLARGLGNLDISSADSTMRGISQMIGGMKFAYGTSIAGVACSLAFNILLRMAHGSAASGLDDYNRAFAELVMQPPVDDSVYHKIHLEDQAAFLNRSATELSKSLSGGIEVAIERAFVPISNAMNSFILAETQSQMEGIHNIVNSFIGQMNNALGGQFMQLAQTFNTINQAQSVSYESVNRALGAADNIMMNIERTHGLTEAIIERFENYVQEMSQAQAGSVHMTQSMADMLGGMHRAVQQQSETYGRLQAGQQDMQEQMQQYAAWSGRVLEAVEKQSDAASERTHEVANQMAASSKALSGSYTSFVENISTGLARTMSLFEENMQDVIKELGRQLTGMTGGGASPHKGEASVDLQSISKLQQAMADMTAALKTNVIAMEQMAEAT